MTPLTLFATLALSAGAALSIYSMARFGSVRNWKDWVPAIAIALVLGFMLTKLARADTFNYTQVFFGLEYPSSEGHPACQANDNQITSNIGIDQNLYRMEQGPISVAVDGTYRHHSCAIGDDDRVSDTLGVNAVLRVQWR